MSDASSDSGDSTATLASSNASRRNGGKTKFERDVDAALRRGVSECKNLLHWEVRRVADPTGALTWTDAGVKRPRDILTIMSPGKAKCSCEKAACRWAWTNNWNHKGMFQTDWVPAGLEQKGIGEVSSGFPARMMFPINYGLTPEDFKFLNARFSEWFFISTSSGSHDHPVAHTSTKIASRRLLDSLPRGTAARPKIYIDLHGNPSANEAYMARNPGIVIMTFVELVTPKDYVRAATKWGPQFAADGSIRYHTTYIRDIPRDHWIMQPFIAGFISIHTTYYYASNEVIMLLAWARQATYHALMHKFDGYVGELNNKEQKWVKSVVRNQTLITQTNVKSGEPYQHPDNSWWYSSDSATDGLDGMAWTTNLACDETFKLTATYCPATICKMSTSCVDVDVLPVVRHTNALAMTQDQIAKANRVTISIYGATSSLDIDPEHVGFFGEMRTTCIGKSRNAKHYQDHLSRCKIRAKSLMSTKPLSIEGQQLADIARYSFFIDFEDQYGADKSMFNEAYATVLMADPMYKSGAGVLMVGTMSLVTDMLMQAVDAKDAKQAVVKAARAGVQHLNRRNVLNTL